MFKKIAIGAATLALSVGIVSTANAAEITDDFIQPSSPTQEATQEYSIISPYVATHFVTRYNYYDKLEYPVSYKLPKTYYTFEVFNNKRYAGTIPQVDIEELRDSWKVKFAGNIQLFID